MREEYNKQAGIEVFDGSYKSASSFMKSNSLSEKEFMQRANLGKSGQVASINEHEVAPLGNVRFSVFALGSSAYPNFCNFGLFVDNVFGQLGGERLLNVATGDEMCGQEQAFKKWAADVFKVALETFCLDTDDTLAEISQMLHVVQISTDTVRFIEDTPEDLINGLSGCHNKKLQQVRLKYKKNLHEKVPTDRETMLLELVADNCAYEPGDHVGILPKNRRELVDAIIKHLNPEIDADKPIRLQLLKEIQSQTGVERVWTPHEKLPCVSLRTLLTRFLDITTPPSPNLLRFLANWTTDVREQKLLNLLANDGAAYEDWRHTKFPHLSEVFEEFPSCKPPAALLVSQLTVLLPRFYSISSSPVIFPDSIHVTVAVVTYEAQLGKGRLHYGVCSNYLKDLEVGEDVYVFIRSAPNFHLPRDPKCPIILVGPGTGIAPFRSFWQQRAALKKLESHPLGYATLFCGSRLDALDLYKDEKKLMIKEGILDKVHTALSREPGTPKTYVQDLMRKDAETIYRQMILENGHLYVCGDCKMAEDVCQTLKTIIQEVGKMSQDRADNYMNVLRGENRYHEDIFGITLRTEEVRLQSHETARIRMASESVAN